MAHAYYHAKSSARRYGGQADDYLWIHTFMDHTKLHFADNRHRLILHNSWGMGMAEQLFGITFTRTSDSKVMPLRPILEQHILEDLGFIPSLEQCLSQIDIQPWMYRQAKQLSKGIAMRALTAKEISTLAEEHEALQEWEKAKQFALTLYGPTAHEVSVETYMESNDEGGADPCIEGVEVADINGNELEPDTTLPGWEAYRKELAMYADEDGEDEDEEDEPDEDAVRTVLRDYVYEDFITAHEDGTSYILDQPPTISFPQVFVQDGTPAQPVTSEI